jgi:hypothetical protein
MNNRASTLRNLNGKHMMTLGHPVWIFFLTAFYLSWFLTVWNSFPDNTIIIDGIPTIRLRNSLLPSIHPADNAVAGICKAFETRSKAYDKFETALALLLKRIKLTPPLSDRNVLSHPVLGLVNFTTLQLMDHLRHQYGTFRATDFANLTLQLQQKMVEVN